MPEGLTVFVKATFYKDIQGETDAVRQAFCEGSPGSCLSNMLGVFRFTDERGDMAKHVAYRDRLARECDALSDRIQRSRSPRPILRLWLWWKVKELRSIRSKETVLAIRQMIVSDVFEEKRGKLYALSDNYALLTRTDELYDATNVKIEMCRGRLTEPALDYVA